MWDFVVQNPVLSVVVAPFVIYALARIVFVAYYHAKRDHIRRVFDGLDSKKGSRTSTDDRGPRS